MTCVGCSQNCELITRAYPANDLVFNLAEKKMILFIFSIIRICHQSIRYHDG